MANPEHVAELTPLDRWTVGLYRGGLCVGAFGLAALAGTFGAELDPVWARWAVLAAVGLIAADLHLYDPTIRWIIGAAGWTGAVLTAIPLHGGVAGWVHDAGLGFLFVVFSAVALKERMCFRLPVVVLVPPLLAGALVPMRVGFAPLAAGPLALAAAVFALLAVAKLRMPVHYDIGDKSRYQV
jgi:uncharacterized integral membrane protein